jgi:inhibitor of KinA sporulation pathway (predicted exonuclease)
MIDIKREEDDLADQLAANVISQQEYNEQMRQLSREFREAYEQAKFEALNQLAEDWGF